MADVIECQAPACRHPNATAAEVCVACGRPLRADARVAAGAPEHAERVLPIAPFTGTAEEIERRWLDTVFRGRGDTMRQLTLRAVLMGSALGGILSLTNIYIGLKAGWGFGVAITSCILSYAIWTTFYRLGLVRTPMTILENNCMQSTASSAGSSTGGTLISAFAAYVMLNNQTMPIPIMMAWVFFVAVLGVTMAIPMKRQMINVEQLRFPSGIAAAETLRALHSEGERGMRAAKALGLAGAAAALSKFWSEGLTLISASAAPYQIGAWMARLNHAVFGSAWMGRTVLLSWEPMFVAAGAITGLRVSASMLVGGVLCWMVYVPLLQHAGVTAATGYRDLVPWTLWGGTACMVTSGLLSFALTWKSALRALGSLTRMLGPRTAGGDPMATIEAPGAWFVAGQLVSLTALAWLAHRTFHMPVWQSVLAVALTFALALVACRVTGETDTTPVGAMGKIMQLTFGVLHPGNVNVNLMSANITAGAAGAAADLLTDLKSGYLLGAHPRKQFVAQFCGIFAGTVVTVLAFSVLVPSASVLGTDQFPAPAAQTWKGVAEAMSKMDQGLWASLGPVKTWSILVGALVGIVLPVLSIVAPPRARAWVPSAAGIGLAWVFHWYYALLFFTGALIGDYVERRYPEAAREYTYPVASGVVAGESLMGVALVFWENGPEMLRALLSR